MELLKQLFAWFMSNEKKVVQATTSEFKEFRGGLNIEQTKKEDADPRNFKLGGWFGGYVPQSSKKKIQTLEIFDQQQLNICVCVSICTMLERKLGVKLSPSFLASLAVQKGIMNAGGTSIQSVLQLVQDVGVAEESVCPSDYSQSFQDFSSPSKLTHDAIQNAALHKIKSYWQAGDLDAVLQQLDQDNGGVGGVLWYDGYNQSNGFSSPWIINPQSGNPTEGHALYEIAGYDLNYQGHKVLIIQNSWGANWGDNGCFYVKFEDWSKFQTYGVYHVMDIEKDIASWLSLNAGKAVLEQGGPKVYVIQGNVKRWISTDNGGETLMEILGFLPSDLIHDDQNMLAQVAQGSDMSINDVPPIQLDHYRRQIQLLNNPATLAQLHGIFPSYF